MLSNAEDACKFPAFCAALGEAACCCWSQFPWSSGLELDPRGEGLAPAFRFLELAIFMLQGKLLGVPA